MRNKVEKTRKYVICAIFSALIVVMAFTPIGYLKLPALSITFIPIPVVVGAAMLGIGGGTFLGLVFGITSLIQCFGLDPFGVALLSYNPINTVILCLVPRILMGLACGLISKSISSKGSEKLSAVITSLSGGILNTLFFVTFLILMFFDAEPVKALGDSVWAIVGSIVTVNSLIEWVACTVIGSAVIVAVKKFKER